MFVSLTSFLSTPPQSLPRYSSVASVPSAFRNTHNLTPHHPPANNPFRITFFAHPHPLTPMESYSCKNRGEGGILRPNYFFPRFPQPCNTQPRAMPLNPRIFIRLRRISARTPPGVALPPSQSFQQLANSFLPAGGSAPSTTPRFTGSIRFLLSI